MDEVLAAYTQSVAADTVEKEKKESMSASILAKASFFTNLVSLHGNGLNDITSVLMLSFCFK